MGVKGIKAIKNMGGDRYVAQIIVNKKVAWREQFESLEEAKKARDEQASILHGEFACPG